MEHVKIYPEEYSRPLRVLMGILAQANVNFFDNNQSWFTRYWKYFYLIPFLIVHFVSMSTSILAELMAGRDLYGFLSLPVFIITIQVIKIIIILSNKRQLEHIIDELGQLWRTEGLNKKQQSVKKAKAREMRIGVIAYLRFPFFVSFQYTLLPLLEAVFNVVRGRSAEWRLPFSAEFGFDVNSHWSLYAVTYAYQVYFILLTSCVYLGTDFLTIALSAHLSREFLLLRQDLTNIQPTRVASDNNSRGRILGFVRSHQKIIRFAASQMKMRKRESVCIYFRLAQKLDEAINKLTFINVLFTTVNVSFFGLSVLASKRTTDRLTNVTIVLTVLMLILIQCYFGEKLKTGSEDIFQAACENQWYEGDIEYQKFLYFIMLRSQKPCYLTSLTFTKITLETFTKVLSTTWSYFSLVNTMYQRQK
nr:odorant receptor 4-like [Plodia interpunctella]